MRGGYEKPFSVIIPLIIINTLVFLVTQYGNSGYELIKLGALQADCLRRFQIWRLVTYAFLHRDFWHIFFNMWGIYLFGIPMERLLGTKHFLILYFISGVIGALLWLPFNWNVPTECIGASGALFGITVACAMAFPDAKVVLLFPPIPMKMRTMVIGYIIIELLFSFSATSSIAHIVHLGGALGGFLYMRYFIQRPWTFRWFSELFHRTPPRRSSSTYNPPDMAPYNEDDQVLNGEALKQVLSKIAKEGYDNLTNEELLLLKRASDAIKRKNQKH